ncbi:MAG: SusC/RagA family TonB-linked outer membrane protein [Bacteroidetes bacterium]|nr:SusC/RagA family TonB-linked outer membrane protein [Bacteroidota bacterium]
MPLNRLIAKCLLPGIFLLLPFISFAQTPVVTGKIVDDKGNPLPGATVTAKGTNVSVTADSIGQFRINTPAGTHTLVISSIGFADKEVAISSRLLTIILTAESKALGDVVVVGYGTVRKKDVTGAVASITSKDFSPGVINNPLQQIQGKVSGLVITQPGGDPNGNLIIRLRGQTSLSGGQTPLIVVDGIPLDDPNQLSNIPATDIASYDVLKDVSATAIYGSRGANGVIIINTKKGASGRPHVEYNAYVGMDHIAKDFGLLSGAQWRTAVKTIPGITQSTIDGLDHGANTDWLKAITRTGYTHSHNVAVSGGSGGFNYRASVNYMKQDGIVINNNKEQYSLRFNAEQKAIDDKLDIQIALFSSQVNRQYVDYNIFDYVNTTPPVYPVHNPDGTYFGYYDYDQQNPVAQQMLEQNTNRERLTQYFSRLDYTILPHLKGGVQGSISQLNTHFDFFQPTLPGVGNLSTASQNMGEFDSKKGDIHLNYMNSFGRHAVSATAVYEYNDFDSSMFSAAGQDYLVQNLQDNNLGGGNPSLNQITSYKQQYKIISFLGRVTYNYNSKYYATVSFRRDGSSKFGINNHWGNFPSASIAWRLKAESFLKDVSWIDDLKLNAGLGAVGNQDAITPYSTLLTLGGSGRYYNPANPNYQYPQSYAPNQNANPDLRWESRHGVNVGATFALFDNRLNGNVNAFSDKTKNLLFTYTVPVPPFFYNTILANVGTLTNKGIELQLNADVIRAPKLSWTVGGQITFVRTRITNLSGTYDGNAITTDQVPVGYAKGRGYDGNAITYLKVGQSPYVFYLPKFAGLAKDIDPSTNSNQLYYAADGSKVADISKAKKYYTDPSPKFTYGINSALNYGSWGLNFFLRGVYGQRLFNNFANITSNISRLPGNNVTKDALTNGIKGSQTASDLWLENASYLRLDNISLSYTFHNVKGFDNLRVYATGNNLFVITPYKGMDPEIRNGNSSQAYIDTNVYGDAFYPRSRTVLIGVNVSFK